MLVLVGFLTLLQELETVDIECNKISLFSITSCQVFVNMISTSCDFCLKTVRHFFFLYLILNKLLFQRFQMKCFV